LPYALKSTSRRSVDDADVDEGKLFSCSSTLPLVVASDFVGVANNVGSGAAEDRLKAFVVELLEI
jgi:hypothetical protein